MNQKKYEQRGLAVGIIFNILMGAAGIWVYHITQIEALFVDAYFTVIAVTSGVAAILISKFSKKKSRKYPNGYFMLEPLYAIAKSSLSLGLLLMAVVNVSQKAFIYFSSGVGEQMNVGPIIPYEIIMVILCFSLAWYYNRQNKRIQYVSTMLDAETKGTIIDGAMSAGIGIVAIVIAGITQDSPLAFLHYTGDFFITVALCIFTIREPLIVIKKSFIELTGGVLIDKNIQATFENIISEHLPKTTMLNEYTIYKVGMSLRAEAEIKTNAKQLNTTELLDSKKEMAKQLSKEFEFVQIDFKF